MAHVIDESPSKHGFPVSLWTTQLLCQWLKTEKKIVTSQDTVERALRAGGYTYRRASRKPPESGASKSEKAQVVKEMVEEILANIEGDAQVLALDESHFSTEPYVVSGWQKKLWPPADTNTKAPTTHVSIWRIEFEDTKVLLEKRTEG